MRFMSLVLFLVGCPDAISTDPGKDSGNEDFDQDGDGYIGEDDCDEGDGTVNVGAPELCDGVDNDCDGSTDEEATDMATFYADADSDGHGDAAAPTEACEQPSGYVESADDCDDTDPAYNPGADESDCTDPNDYNCDGSVAYADADADGSPACEDCDDGDAARSPLLTESCNDIDDDCDSEVDEDAADATTWYLDADQDGYGVDTTLVACDRPEGYAEYNGDCDDATGRYHPGAEEVDCTDPNDYNCDGSTGYADADADGFAACQECDDSEASIYPGATEYCDDADNNCDGEIDESTAVDASTWYADDDRDGYGAAAAAAVACDAPLNYVSDSTDCDDTDVETYPGAPEYCDGEDDNCDGTSDEDSALDAATWYADADNDGFGDAASTDVACDKPEGFVADSTDCDDSTDQVSPAATEYCNGTDDNCDGSTDEDSAADAITWYADADSDGYGDAGNTYAACELPSGYTADDTDCDDSDAAVSPVGTEMCNGYDDDCDGEADESTALDAATWFADGDSDGYGDPGIGVAACSQPSGYVADDTDCDDTDGAEYPGATEYCDGDDDNCDGEVDEDTAADVLTWYADRDRDSFGNASASDIDCEQPSGYVADSTDCDDTDGAEYPGATEYCDGDDDNCDGEVDEDTAADVQTWYRDADGDSYGYRLARDTDCDQPTGYVADNTDCDDLDDDINPGEAEVCDDDDTDEDCDGDADDDDPSATGQSTWHWDRDGDGYGDSFLDVDACNQPADYVDNADDCDPFEVDVNPGAQEVCDRRDTDEDCDGLSDDDDPSATGQSSWYLDGDSDSYGDATTGTSSCDASPGYVADDTDCDDSQSTVSPAGTEVCDDGADDEDCDGLVDDDDPSVTGTSSWYYDDDGDGFGDSALSTSTCVAPGDYVADSTDCDDDDATIYPGAEEVCVDGTDSDCDGDRSDTDCYHYGSGVVTDYDDASWYGLTTSDQLASGLAGVGDLDGDGADDIGLGAHLYDTSYAANTGAAWFMSGASASGSTQLTQTVTAIATVRGVYRFSAVDYMGYQLDGAGDFDNDGELDVVVGAYNTRVNNGTSYGAAGEAIVFSAPSGDLTRGSSSAVLVVQGNSSSEYVGYDVSGGYDVDGNGVPEVLVGGYGYDYGGTTNTGAAGLFYGGSGGTVLLSSADVLFYTSTASDQTGQVLAMVPDLGGDGRDEMVICAYKGDGNGSNDGIAYVVFGDGSLASGHLSTVADVVIEGSGTTDAELCRSVDTAGDYDGDGDNDLVVGAHQETVTIGSSSYSDAGAAYVFSALGSSMSVADATVTLTGNAANLNFGRSVAGGGDFDGNGTDDVIVGASGYDSPASNAGGAFLWYGPIASGTYALDEADFAVTGVFSSDALGGQLAFAGDTDADGFDDFLVGASGWDQGTSGSSYGGTWLIRGSGE
ncbi:MAG: hypothetical protein FJ102_04415 [Deltaproteobacteria bacterium]|nr:hypothetical protein [Deltaproteobacteria bacterium]